MRGLAVERAIAQAATILNPIKCETVTKNVGWHEIFQMYKRQAFEQGVLCNEAYVDKGSRERDVAIIKRAMGAHAKH